MLSLTIIAYIFALFQYQEKHLAAKAAYWKAKTQELPDNVSSSTCTVQAHNKKKTSVKSDKAKDVTSTRTESTSKQEIINVDSDSKENSEKLPELNNPNLKTSSKSDKPYFKAANREYQTLLRKNISPVSYVGKKK